MSTRFQPNLRRRVPLRPTLVLVLVLGSVLGVVALRRAATTAENPHQAGMVMTDWFANHPRVGVNSTQAVTATFMVKNYTFDSDGNSATQVDTVRIAPSETVKWQWVSGNHTITSGNYSSDPQAGVLFDQPSTYMSTSFSFTFDTPGTYSFFCRNHESLNMKGVVVVMTPTPTRRDTWTSLRQRYQLRPATP